MDGLAAAADRVRGIEQTLQSLRAGVPGTSAFSGVLAQVSARGAAPARAEPAQESPPSADWSRAVQRPALLAGAGPRAATATGTTDVRAQALAGYGNGQLPDSALVPIGGGERLQADAAAGFLGMRGAAARDGVELGVNDSYRSLQEQRDMAARKGLYSQGGLAARPGTSTHGVGRSVDLHLDEVAQQWMRRNAAQFGYTDDVAREPWHWTFSPSTDAG